MPVPACQTTARGKRLILFATLHYWIEQAVIVGLVLRAMGHDVTVAYLPYSDWQTATNRFDLQRQDLYTRKVLLAPLADLVKVVSLFRAHGIRAVCRMRWRMLRSRRRPMM